jgi:uncharacterized membrane protein YeaQ/YmgE (transglycosylase-associated protein family)
MGAFIGTVIGALIAGIIIGPLARLVLPGRQNLSIGMTILLGAVGAFVGGLIAQWLGLTGTGGVDWLKFFIQIGVAAAVVTIYAGSRSRST